MEITCEHCQSKIKVPDEKAAKLQGKQVSCPKCKQKITIPKIKAQGSTQKAAQKKPPAEAGPGTENGEGPINPFEFLEEGAKTAMICEVDDKRRQLLKQFFEGMGYHISEPENPRDALKQMRFHEFDVVVLNEIFGTKDPEMNHVLKYLSQLKMSVRRNMFVSLLTSRFKTSDRMQAFNKSVNSVLNINDMAYMEKILKRDINENESFYRVFKESVQKFKG